MTATRWRGVAIVLAVVCCVQRWQSCTRSHGTHEAQHSAAAAEDRAAGDTTREATEPRGLGSLPQLPHEDAAARTKGIFGFHPPAWAMRLLPQPGEAMRDYRERIVPIAQLAIAPQRARVARMRDAIKLAPQQRAELDAAVGDAAKAIENRVAAAIINGELQPATFKPMTGVAVARDVLDIVDRGNARFVGSLTPEQRTQLSSSRFDFADYLLFSTRWEDALPH